MNDKTVGVAMHQKNNPQQPFEIYFLPELSHLFLTKFQNLLYHNNNNIFIGTENGFINLNIEKYITNEDNLKSKISSIKITTNKNQDSIVYNGFESQKALLNQTFYSNLHAIIFNFATNQFENSGVTEFSFKLVGYDKEWSKWSKMASKEYTNLPYKTYTFQLKAKNNKGIISTIKEFHFTILPPWYKSTLAYFFYGIIVIALFIFLIKINNIKTQKKQRLFEEEQKKKAYILQLELQKSEREIIRLKSDNLEKEVNAKNKELLNSNIHLSEQSDILIKIENELNKLNPKQKNNIHIKKAFKLIVNNKIINNNWENFEKHFNIVNDNFLEKIKLQYPKITVNDLKLCAFLKLNLSTKEIAQLLNISVRGAEISRYRLRKKLNLNKNENFKGFFENK